MDTKRICRLLIAGLGLALWLLPAAQAKPGPAALSGFPWSRSRQQDKAGYYDQPTGLCEDYPQNERTQARLDRDFQVMHWAGVKLLRVGISWVDVENGKGQYDWSFWDRLVATASRNHVLLIPYVCYMPEWAAARRDNFWKQPPADAEDFGAFMRVIATRYRGRVHSWELWNEPDNPDFWLGSVAEYAHLVQAGARGVRLADPTDIVVLGGLADGDSPFGRKLLQMYHVGRDVGAVNFHGYDETWNRKPLEDYAREATDLSSAVSIGSPHPDLWMAEFGYSNLQPPTSGGYGEAPAVYDYQHTADYQAAALFKSHVLALSTGRLSLTAWYRINDLPAATSVIGDAENRYLGVVDVQGRPKPALAALTLYNRLFGGPTRCLDHAVKITLPTNSQSVLHVFEQKRGRIIVVGWLRSPVPGEVPNAPVGAPDTRAEKVSLVLPAGVSGPVVAYDLSGVRILTRARLAGRLLGRVVLTGAKPFIATVDVARNAARQAGQRTFSLQASSIHTANKE